jgi:predicted TIM-barrel fold metal-dependent hydrolase
MRLEVLSHLAAEERLRTAILGNVDYAGKEADLERVKRKQKELGLKGVRQVLKGGWG